MTTKQEAIEGKEASAFIGAKGKPEVEYLGGKPEFNKEDGFLNIRRGDTLICLKLAQYNFRSRLYQKATKIRFEALTIYDKNKGMIGDLWIEQDGLQIVLV